ncbi:MAG TPA: SgcJ/EcaC family oxidoreductase [Caulobacteraceae bacterium]|nr:SgcJ/EcaC family oxidoreductase [Caulobacteraceae bacterium]
MNNEARAVAALIDAFVDGWNAADGAKLASVFATDADFTAVNGLRVHGRDLIGEGHDELFRTLFRGVTLASKVVAVRFLTADIAVVEADLSYPNGILPGVTRALAHYVAQRSDAGWKIAVFRNMIPFERPVAGPVEERVRAEMAQA